MTVRRTRIDELTDAGDRRAARVQRLLRDPSRLLAVIQVAVTFLGALASAVAECGVVGVPDEERGQIVKAFVVLKSGVEASDALAADIQGFVRTRLSAHEYPREVAFIAEMPMTTTGKVIRRLLRARV